MTKISIFISAGAVIFFWAGLAYAQTTSVETGTASPQASTSKSVMPYPKALQKDDKDLCDAHFHQKKMPKDSYNSFMAQCVRTRQYMRPPLPVSPSATTTSTK